MGQGSPWRQFGNRRIYGDRYQYYLRYLTGAGEILGKSSRELSKSCLEALLSKPQSSHVTAWADEHKRRPLKGRHAQQNNKLHLAIFPCLISVGFCN